MKVIRRVELFLYYKSLGELGFFIPEKKSVRGQVGQGFNLV